MTVPNSLWPLFGLTLTTPRLVLRPVTDDDLPAAVAAARSGIHEPGKSPFSTPWAEAPDAELGPGMARWHWRSRAESTPEAWSLILGIWHDGGLVGCQDVGAKDFARLKTVSTGSWLKQSVHGRGFGKEMRSAVVLYAFDWLRAEVAESEAALWNAASLGVSRSLGYGLNGVTRTAWGNKAVDVQKVRVTAATFKRPDWELQVKGHEAAARFLGISWDGSWPAGPATTPARTQGRA